MKKLLHLLLSILLWYLSASGQEYPMRHYTINDGLPSNTVYQVFRDSKGYLWLATDKGVARYNGIKFEKFTTFNGLTDNEVFLFAEDLYGRIWFGTYNGELCYYQNDSFHTAKNTSFLKIPDKSPYIYSIVCEKDSSVTINFYDRSFILNITKDKCKVIPVIYEDAEGRRVIFGRKTDDGNYKMYYKHRGQIFGPNSISVIDGFGKEKKKIEASFSRDTKIFSNQNATFFLDSCYFYNDELKLLRTTVHRFPYASLAYTFYDDGTDFFIGIKDGMYISDSIHIMQGKWVVSVTTDSYGNYWIGTHDDGVYCLSKNFRSTKAQNRLYTGSVVYTQPVEGHLFFVTGNNNLYSMKQGKVSTVFKYETFRKSSFPRPNDAAYIIDESNNYYGTYYSDIVALNDVLSEKPRVRIYENPFATNNVRSVYSYRGYLYLKGRDLIMRARKQDLSKGQSVWEVVVNLLDKDRIFCAAQNTDSSIWYSTSKLMAKIVDGRVVVQPQFNDISFKTFAFFGRYLLGITHLNQLLLCSNIEGRVHIDTVPQQDCVWEKLYKLDNDNVLISTDNLYMCLRLLPGHTSHPFFISPIEDPFVPVHTESVCADSAMCYFFKEGTVTSIAIKNLIERPRPPQLLFSNLRTARNKYSITSEVEVSFEEAKNMNISFSTLAEWGKDIVYQYSISKDEIEHWRELPSETISLFNPGYGDYVIRVRAKSVASAYGAPISFVLHISRPYWATWWFILLGVCIAGALVGLLIRVRIVYILRKNKKKHETEMRFVKSEYKALNALMNPHFIFNTLNNVQSLFNENDKISANIYLRIFADLIRQNMHNVSKELITLQKEMDLVTNYLLLEKLRFEDKLNYSIKIGNGLDLTDIMVPPLLIQPIVENAIKHGILHLNSADAMISISLYEKDDMLYIEVKDNGIGMSTSQKRTSDTHESIGLSNIKKRIEHLSIIQNRNIVFDIRDIQDERGSITGTIATITMSVS